MIGIPAFSEKYGVSPDTARKWCRKGLIPGAEHDGEGKPWRIPEDAVPPKSSRHGKLVKNKDEEGENSR